MNEWMNKVQQHFMQMRALGTLNLWLFWLALRQWTLNTEQLLTETVHSYVIIIIITYLLRVDRMQPNNKCVAKVVSLFQWTYMQFRCTDNIKTVMSSFEHVKYSSLLNTLTRNCFDDEQYAYCTNIRGTEARSWSSAISKVEKRL